MTTSLSYRHDIDGLRALSVWLVVIYHAFVTLLPAGFLGVDIFFVISGFIISRSIAYEIEHRQFNIFHFYGRRIRRIFPTLLLVLGVALIVGYVRIFPDEYQHLAYHARMAAVFFSNYVMWYEGEGGYFSLAADLKPLMHLWSLAVEEHFYIVWPWLLWGVSLLCRTYTRAAWVCIGVILWVASFVYGSLLLKTDTNLAFYSSAARAWQLATGGLIALSLPLWQKHLTRWMSHALSIMFVTLLGIAITYLNVGILPKSMWTLWAVSATACFIIAGEHKTFIHRLFSTRFMVYNGKISYALYLWHWTILGLYNVTNAQEASVVTRIYLITLSVLLAALSERFVERPCRAAHAQTTKTIGLIVGMLCIFSAGTYILQHNGFTQRYPQEQVKTLLAPVNFEWEKYVQQEVCYLQTGRVTTHASHCTAHNKIALWGDSHAASLYAGLSEFYPQLAQLTYSGCPPLWSLPASGYTTTCDANNNVVLQRFNAIQPQVLLLHAAWNRVSYPLKIVNLKKWLQYSLHKIRTTLPHTQIVVLGPVPNWRFDPNIHTFMMWQSSGDVRILYSDRLKPMDSPELDTILQDFVTNLGYRYISLRNILCNDAGCVARVGNAPSDTTAIDYGHLSHAGALFVSKYLSAQLDALFTIHGENHVQP